MRTMRNGYDAAAVSDFEKPGYYCHPLSAPYSVHSDDVARESMSWSLVWQTYMRVLSERTPPPAHMTRCWYFESASHSFSVSLSIEVMVSVQFCKSLQQRTAPPPSTLATIAKMENFACAASVAVFVLQGAGGSEAKCVPVLDLSKQTKPCQ